MAQNNKLIHFRSNSSYFCAVNLDDLFIGDYLRILSKGVIGRFDGIEGEQAKVKVGEKIWYAEKANLEIVPDEEAERMQIFNSGVGDVPERIDPEKQAEFHDELDLHLEALENAGYVQFNYETILQFQLRICARFIREADKLGVGRIRIIHGKGEGILKAEVAHLLDMDRAVTDFEPDHTGGAFVAWLNIRV